MKNIALLAFISLSLVSVSSIAGTGEVKGKSTCTKVYSLDKKQSKSMPCTYSGTVGGSQSYGITELRLNLSNGDIYNVVNNLWFEQDGRGNFLWKESDISINGSPAEILYLQPKTLKEIHESKRNRPEYSKLLQCFKPIDSSSAFCIPYELIASIN